MYLGHLGHLSYCSNIHPGETWAEVFHQLKQHLPALKRQLSPHKPFGVGLRLSAEAAKTLTDPAALKNFREWLAEQGFYVFTLNGFPYGTFHGEPIKEQVYRPDWSRPERLEYTCMLADILAALLPADVSGSISTVPGAFKPDVATDSYRQQIVDNLVMAAAHLRKIARDRGRHICLALEPEPACLLETVDETLEFFRRELFTEECSSRLANACGEPQESGADHLRDHLGVCLDTCHASVMFENPLQAANRIAAAGIRIAKLQLTAALSIERINDEVLANLQAFSDPIYLHQTSVLRDGAVQHYLDLPQACADYVAGSSWRCHYHVPVFLEDLGPFQTTAGAVADLLQQHRISPFSEHLEVETYTFDLIPEQYRQDSVTDNISREIAWVREALVR